MSGVPLDVILSVDEWRGNGIVSARGLLARVADVGATSIKVIACRPDQYSTRAVHVTQVFPAGDSRIAAIAAGAPGASAAILADIRSMLGPLPLVVAPYDITSCREAANSGIDTWQVDEAMNANVPMLDLLARVARRVYFCTWGCTEREIDAARTILHATELVFLHRVHARPPSALLRDCARIAYLAGLGHRIGWQSARPTRSQTVLALALGGSVVEIAATAGGLDAGEAATRLAGQTRMLRGLAESSRQALLGCSPGELDEIDQLRPGLVAACAIPAGTLLTPDMIALRAPALGLAAEHLGATVGRRTTYDLRTDDPITFGVVS